MGSWSTYLMTWSPGSALAWAAPASASEESMLPKYLLVWLLWLLPVEWEAGSQQSGQQMLHQASLKVVGPAHWPSLLSRSHLTTSLSLLALSPTFTTSLTAARKAASLLGWWSFICLEHHLEAQESLVKLSRIRSAKTVSAKAGPQGHFFVESEPLEPPFVKLQLSVQK